MADMPKMQEHFSAAAMDGRHAENAGAFFGGGHGWPTCRKCRRDFLLLDSRTMARRLRSLPLTLVCRALAADELVAQAPGEGLRCVVRFQIDDAQKVARTSRQGGGQECWSVWRRYEP
jgi:hypothetical protein